MPRSRWRWPPMDCEERKEEREREKKNERRRLPCPGWMDGWWLLLLFFGPVRPLSGPLHWPLTVKKQVKRVDLLIDPLSLSLSFFFFLSLALSSSSSSPLQEKKKKNLIFHCARLEEIHFRTILCVSFLLQNANEGLNKRI